MQNTYWRNNKDERRLLSKNTPLTLFERLCVRGSWRPNRTAIYWPPLLWPSALCLSRSPGLLNQRPGGSAFCWLLAFSTASCPKLVWSPNWFGLQLTDFLSTPSYIIVQRPLLLVGVTISLIQPIHGQGYNILIDRMHLLFTKVHFLFWQPGRAVGQYTTIIRLRPLKKENCAPLKGLGQHDSSFQSIPLYLLWLRRGGG